MAKDDLGSSKWKQQRLRVLERDQWICSYCGEQATEVDHVIPRKVGGDHSMDNLVASCRRCNLAKGARSEALFLHGISTPLVLVGNPSPITVGSVLPGPFEGQPRQKATE